MSPWCAFCVKEIAAAGLTFKDKTPGRSVTQVDGTAVCRDHTGAALDRYEQHVVDRLNDERFTPISKGGGSKD